MNDGTQMQYYRCILKGLSGFANGMAPIMAVEIARRCFQTSIQPTADDLENMLKELGK